MYVSKTRMLICLVVTNRALGNVYSRPQVPLTNLEYFYLWVSRCRALVVDVGCSETRSEPSTGMMRCLRHKSHDEMQIPERAQSDSLC